MSYHCRFLALVIHLVDNHPSAGSPPGLTIAGGTNSFCCNVFIDIYSFCCYKYRYEDYFRPVQNAANIVDRGLSFDMVADIDWNDTVILEDIRKDYGERRLRVFGYIRDRLYVAVVTPRNEAVHFISFRKANTREVKEHGNQ